MEVYSGLIISKWCSRNLSHISQKVLNIIYLWLLSTDLTCLRALDLKARLGLGAISKHQPTFSFMAWLPTADIHILKWFQIVFLPLHLPFVLFWTTFQLFRFFAFPFHFTWDVYLILMYQKNGSPSFPFWFICFTWTFVCNGKILTYELGFYNFWKLKI